jgi:uncharacterized membrane protein YidH (DUF202 family)
MVAVPAARRSTTQLVLRRLLGYLLLVTVVVLATTLWAFHRVHDAADSVRTRTAPAILGLVLARDALAKADGAAINSFLSGEVYLVGPGQEYRNQFAIASQSLNQVAEDNAAGELGSRTLQVVEGMLEVYTNLIGQADVDYRRSGGVTLGVADLWTASRLLHNQDGVLAQLDVLLSLERQAFDDQQAASSTTWLVVLVSVGPIVALLGLLVSTQSVLRRRFRRLVEPFLVLAALALVGLSVFLWLVFGLSDQLAASRTIVTRTAGEWSTALAVTDSAGKRDLGQFMRNICGQPPSGCGGAVDGFVADVTRTPPVRTTDAEAPAGGTRAVEQATVRSPGSELWIFALTGIIAIAVLFGLVPRIDEYRYRPT